MNRIITRFGAHFQDIKNRVDKPVPQHINLCTIPSTPLAERVLISVIKASSVRPQNLLQPSKHGTGLNTDGCIASNLLLLTA